MVFDIIKLSWCGPESWLGWAAALQAQTPLCSEKQHSLLASWPILTLLSITFIKARQYYFIPTPRKGHYLGILSRKCSTSLQLFPLLFMWFMLRVRIKGKWSSCGSWPCSAGLCHLQTIFRLPLYSKKRLPQLLWWKKKRYSILARIFKIGFWLLLFPHWECCYFCSWDWDSLTTWEKIIRILIE